MSKEVMDYFFSEYENRFSSETVRSYRIAIKQFFEFCERNYDQVRAANIRAWLAHMEEEGLKPRSIQLKLAGLKSFYQFCMEENKIKKNPATTVRNPKKADSLPRYLTKHQLALLQEHTRGIARERAIVEALYATGARINELLDIKLEDIKWESKQIWIRKGKGNKERFVLFTHECSERLQAYLQNREVDSDYLFCNQHGERLSSCFVQMKFQEYSEALGFKIVPHTMRHTFATHLAERGMAQSYIQELLGHTNINSTHIYTRLLEQARKDKYDTYQL